MITVSPESFDKVLFDSAQIGEAAQRAAEVVPGFDERRSFEVAVDGERPTTRVWLESMEPLVLAVESGALEQTKQPRTLSEQRAMVTIARLLIEVTDRESPDFGGPELPQPTDLSIKVAWDIYCYGRLRRLGLTVAEAALRYNFRNRVGFSDAADEAFDRLWSANNLTYADIVKLSAG